MEFGAAAQAEADDLVGVAADEHLALVDEPVVMPAEHDQVAFVGGAAMGPVDDVVGIEEAPMLAAREAAAAVAGLDRAAQGKRDDTRSSPD